MPHIENGVLLMRKQRIGKDIVSNILIAYLEHVSFKDITPKYSSVAGRRVKIPSLLFDEPMTLLSLIGTGAN